MIGRSMTLAMVSLAACTGAGDAAAARDDGALADVTAYAQASCFARQDQPYLREQGERWADAIIQRGAGSPEAWTPVADAVQTELARSGVKQGRPDGPQAPTAPLTVMTCGEIANAPPVRAAIARAAAALAPAYRARGR